MTTAYGVQDQGFVAKPLDQILSEINSDVQNAIGISLDLSPQESLGQINGIMAEQLSELWEGLHAVYDAFNPDAAAGAQQDDVCALTGTVRKAPTSTKVTGTCGGTPGTPLTAGRVASVQPSGERFASQSDVTLADPGAWVTGATYVLNDRVSSNGLVFSCRSSGVAGSTAPASGIAVGSACSDGTLTWLCISAGVGVADVEFDASDAGPVLANAGTLSRIETPASGWSSIYNLLDAFEEGKSLETDAALRVRREAELRAQGLAAVAAIQQAVLAVANVQACYVFDNRTDAVDANGLTAHSFEAVVQGGDDDAIRAAIFAAGGAGIATNGGVSGVVYDSQGQPQTVKFSRPGVVPIYAVINATIDPLAYPTKPDGSFDENAIVAALLIYGVAQYVNGADVISAALLAQVFAVAGVVDCALPFIGTSAGPTTSTTIPISILQLAQLDSSRIAVNLTPRSSS